ncbi:hypothetical protein ACP4OV_013582 [Aristida adscensionis]
MGRGRVELKRIENRVRRQVSFSKRRAGLLKKAHELAVLCGAQVGVIVFSEAGKLFEYSNPLGRMNYVIHRYDRLTASTQLQETSFANDHQMMGEILRLRRENEVLEADLRRYTGEDLSSVASVGDLDALERRLDSAVRKVRERKDELMAQLMGDLRRKINDDDENNRRDAAGAVAVGVEADASAPRPGSPPASSTALQMWPQGTDDAGGGFPGGSTTSASPPGRGLWLW